MIPQREIKIVKIQMNKQVTWIILIAKEQIGLPCLAGKEMRSSKRPAGCVGSKRKAAVLLELPACCSPFAGLFMPIRVQAEFRFGD